MINTAKRLSALALALMLIFGSVTVCFAEIISTDTYVIDDGASLFSNTEITQLETKLDEAGKKTGWQFIVHTDSKQVYADSLRDYYEENYFEKGNFKSDSVVLVINKAMNKGTFFANGNAAYYINDARVSELGVKLRADMDNGNYYLAATDFTDGMLKYNRNPTAEVEKREGKLPYVLKHYWWLFAIIALVAGGATYGITAGKYKYNGKYNTYNLKENSQTQLSVQQDMFVTKHTTSHTIQSSSSSGSSHSSGSGGSRGGDF